MIVCCDGLTGLPDAIEATWPLATVQTCVVHLVRASVRYVARADYKAVCDDLRNVYTASTLGTAETRWLEFTETWGAKYPAVIGVVERAWEQFTPFLAFPAELFAGSCTQQSDRVVGTRGSVKPSAGGVTSPLNKQRQGAVSSREKEGEEPDQPHQQGGKLDQDPDAPNRARTATR